MSKSSSLSKSESDALETAAARWFTRMRSDQRTVQDEDAFNRWMAGSPDHEEAYRALEALWGGLEPHRNAPAVQILCDQALEESRRHHFTWRRLGRGRRLLVPGLVAACAAAALLTVWLSAVQEGAYRTDVGDRKTVRLSDGSEITLNTNSTVRVSYGLWSRNIELESGEAHFKVAHNPLRPFLVDAGNGVIRAVGTEFDVYRQPDTVQVTLIEGKIEVRDRTSTESTPKQTRVAELTAGEEISLAETGLSAVKSANIPKATAWLQGQLIFDQERLADALAEVNRYSSIKLQVLDPKLAELRISGVFHAGSAQTFVDALHASFSVTATPTADGSLVLKR